MMILLTSKRETITSSQHFFEKQHQALSIVSGCGAMPWLLDSEAEERIRSDIATAEVLKANLEMRIEALHRSLGELG